MARIRTIKPEFWTDDKIISLPYCARLFFIGIWNFADDYGCIQDKPDQLKLLILPSDESFDANQMLDLLIAADLIERFVDIESETVFLVIKNWFTHQKVDKPTKSKILKEGAKKATIPAWVRQSVAKKYGCIPGKTKQCECYFCGTKGSIYWATKKNGEPSFWVCFSLELSHLISESQGGDTSDDNIVLACRNCNRTMGIKNAFDWLFNGKYYTNQKSSVIEEFRERSRVFDGARDGKERKGMEGNGKEVIMSPIGESMPSLYEDLVKTKESIYEFIKNKSPGFIEPYVDFWNLFAREKGMSEVKNVNDKRKKKFKVRIKEQTFDFPAIIRKASKSEFILTGKWFGFDWIIENDSNYLKVLEGSYDKKEKVDVTNSSYNDNLKAAIKNGLNKPE